MKHFALIVLAAFLLGAGPALATETPLETVVQSLEGPFRAESGGISDFRAEFHQSSRLASLNREQQGRGEVVVRFDQSAPEATRTKFRWDYKKPTEQLIVSNGQEMWVYIPENRQAIRTEIDQHEDRPEDPLTFLTGLGNLSRDFNISWADPARDDAGNYILELRPQVPSPMIESLRVVVNRKAVSKKSPGIFPILSTVVLDPSGNTTQIEFQQVRTNIGIPDKTFQFTPPKGVDVVRPAEVSGSLY